MNTIKSYSRLILFPMFVLYLGLTSYSQDNDFVRPGPGGLFVGLGNSVPCGVKTSAYKIERSSKGGNWSFLAEIKTPSLIGDFLTQVDVYKVMFPGNSAPPKEELEKLWQKAHQSGVFEPADSWVLSFPVRMAFGMMYLDRETKENGMYLYRVTAMGTSGEMLEQHVSAEVKWPFIPIFDTIRLSGLERTAKLLSLKWKSFGKNPAHGFSVFCFENEKPRLMPGRSITYAKNDTAYYLYQDTSAQTLAMKGLMCYMVPADNYGNKGRAGTVIMANAAGFHRVFFRRSHAEKVSGYLGIKLTWRLSDPSSVKKIEIYRSLDSQKDFKLITTIPPSDTSFIDPNVIPDKVQYYYLQACGEFDFQSVRSNVFFDYGMDTRPPVTPAIFKAEGVKNGAELYILLNDINMAGVRIYRSNGLTDSLLVLGDLVRNDSNTLVFRDTSMALNGYYYYQYAVRSENTSHFLSAFSNTVSIRPLKTTFPDPPVVFNAYLDNQKVKLFWHNGESSQNMIQGYRLTRTESDGNNNDVKPAIGLPSEEAVLTPNFYTDSLVKPGKTYTYRVQTVDIYNGISLNPVIYTIDIPLDLPIPPADLKAINTPEGAVLEWGPAVSENSTLYRIYRYQRGSDPQVIKLVGKDAVTFTDTSVQKGQLYFYYITTLDKKDTESVPCGEVGIYY